MVSLFFTLPRPRLCPCLAGCDKNEQLPSGQANCSYMQICIIKWMCVWCVCVSVCVLLVCTCVHCTLVCAATEGYIGAYKHKISCCLPQKVQKKRNSNIANFTKRRRKTSQLFLHTVISSTFQSQIPWQEMNVINAATNDANYSIWMCMCACECSSSYISLAQLTVSCQFQFIIEANFVIFNYFLKYFRLFYLYSFCVFSLLLLFVLL